jgi:hypothetical protein
MGQAKIKRMNILPLEFSEVAMTSSEEAAFQAIQAIRSRSFSGRHPELGKMLKCQVCGRPIGQA